MIQARKDGNISTNESPRVEEQTSGTPVQVQRAAPVRTVQQAIDPRRAAYVAAPTAVLLSADGGNIPEGVQYRRVSIAPQLQHVVTPVQVQAASSTSTTETPLTVAPRCTTQDLVQLLATTSNSTFHTVELQNSSAGHLQRTPRLVLNPSGSDQPQRLVLNSTGSDQPQQMFTLRLGPSTSGGATQQFMLLDPASISQPADVTKVHSYSLASSAMQKIAIGQPHKTQVRAGVKRQLATAPPRTFTSGDVLSHLSAVNRLLFGLVPCDGTKPPHIPGSPKPKKIKLEKPPNNKDAAKRARVTVALLKKLQLLKMKYYQQQTEYFFLKNGGNLVDFIAWRKKMTPNLLDYLRANRFEQQDEQPNIQEVLLQSAVHGIRHPLLSQASDSKSTSSQSQRLVSPGSSPKGSRSPFKQHSSKHNSISSVYDSQIGSQEEIVERAKQEAYVLQRIADLRKEGMWSLKRLPKVADAPRIKAHHDYLLEEMVWLATDFAQERKWKKAAAKKCARMITRYFQEKEIKAEKAEKEEQMRLRKIASIISREIKTFWNNIEKLAEYRQQTWLEEKRKKVLDTHLNFIVDQTEKYSSWLTQGMNQPNTPESPRPSEEDFSPSSSDGEIDDEATIQKEEENIDETEQSEEIKLLQQESEMPFEDFLDSLPPEMLNESSYSVNTEEQKTPEAGESSSKGVCSDDEFQVSEEEEDDERTILEQEEGEGEVNHAQEIQDLEAENEMSIEQLREKYSAAFTTPPDVGTPEQPGSENESQSSDEFSDEEELNDDEENSLLKELSSDNLDASGNPSKEISDIAATAESFQPKGNTLSTTQVCTKVPFLLKHQLREYQHIGLDWLNAMYEKKLNGILADEMGLGKTIQTISVLAHLACEKGVWGPHLIVVPTSVMLNWEMELKKWCPAFKILTYYGTPKERKQKRVGWTKPNAFHVCITSYKLVVQDHQSFRRKRWKYMILDEAQHIKNFKSQRWQMLLNFQSSHRLLLTGTPLQNNLMELWSLMHFLMPNVFQSHREFREWFVNPFTGMIEGSGEYNDSLIKRLHKVLRPFLLRRLKCEVEKQLPKKYEHVVMCRLSNRQRYLYDDFMSQTKTKETLATGNFMSVINILMQLRKVCNHPNMFEERPTVSPFMMEGIRFNTASLAYKALDYDPFKQVSLLSLNLLLADLELLLTAFAAHRVKKFQVPQKLIEEIDTQPDPPPQCPAVKMKVNFCNSQASSGSSSATPPRPPATPRPPAPPQPRAGVVGPQPQRFMVFPGQQVARSSTPVSSAASTTTPVTEQQYTLQFVQPGAAIGGGLTLQLQQPTTRVHNIQSLIGGIGRVVQTAQGAHFVITSVPNSVTETTTTPTVTTAQTSLVLTSNLATVMSQNQRMTNPAVSPPFLSTLNRTPLPPNNRPVGRVAPFNGHPSVVTTPTESAPVQNHVQTPTKSPLVHNLSKPTPKLEVPTEKKNSLFYLDALSNSREQERKDRLSTLARINSYRCSACPIYGKDLVEAVTLVNSLQHPRMGDPWAGKGYVNCLNAVGCRKDPKRFWEHTTVLSEIVRTPEDRVDQLYDVINRFVFGVPAVTAPALEMHVSHPHPWRLNEERRRIEVISEHLAPSSTFLHPIVSNMNTQFPELRLIQYDCGKLQRLAHLMWELKSNQHRVLIFTQMTRMLDILEQFLNYHGHTYLRLDGNTKVEQRQCLMERFNADKRIFCFILSTRSGGIGVNLTGADTVIFYDSDWNPTMDAQAQDRCHRIGQTRDVHIYRLISERTIEENILKKANQKRILGNLAIEGGNFTTAFFKKNTIHDLFGLDMQGDLKRLMAEEKRLEEEKLENEKFSQKELEQALGMAEEESDLQAAQTASAEAVAELAEFDESIPLDNDSRDNEEKSTAEEELDKLMDQLSPVERYALQFLESLQEPVGLEQLKLAEEEIEAQKKDWELGHLKALKQEEERLGDEENPLFCSREASNQVYFSINGQEEMPIWAPPTPPTDENDIYIDYSMNFWYEPSFMHEALLPPIFIKKEAKRLKMDPIVSVSTARKQKVRKDDMVSIPRSLFDRPSQAILKMRREVKLQKVKGLMVSPKQPPPPFPMKQSSSLLVGKSLQAPAMEGSSPLLLDKPEWHVQEDWALLQVIQDLQNIPLNLTVLSPAHTPNWDLASEVVYSALNRFHSPKNCRARYENVIVPREEGKILYDTNPKKQKKTKGIYKTKNNRPMKTSQLYLQDNNQMFMKTARDHLRLVLEQQAKRRASERAPFLQAAPKSGKVASVLAENGIAFDQPLTPMQIAQLRSERIAREKQKNAPAATAPLALAPVLQTVTSPQVATATVVSQVPEQQTTTVTVATGTIHPNQAQAVLATLHAQQLQLSKGVQPSAVSLSKSLPSGIMVSSSTASTLATLTKALGQSTQATTTQNAAIAAALNNASIRNQRATTTTIQEIVAAGGQVRAVSTAASVAGGINPASTVVSVSNLAAVQLATTQRLAGATLAPVTTVATATGTVTQLTPQAAATQRSIAQMTQMQMRQNAIRRETALKQQLKRIHSVQQQGTAQAGTAAKSGQPRVTQQVTMKQAAVGRPMTEAEVTQLMKRQQQKHAVNVNLTASQILAQVQPQQVAISSGATLVKTVSSPLAIPVSAVTMGGVNINVSMPQGKAGVVQAKGGTITNQQLRQFQIQQQLLQARKPGSKMQTANLTQIAKVPGKGGVTAGTSVQIVPQGVKNLQTAMTVAQIQQAMKQLPQNMPVVVTATPSLSGVQQQPVGAVKATTLPSTTLTTSGVLKGSTALTGPQAVTLAVRATQGQQQLQIQVQQSPHATLVSPQTQVVTTAALTQARMQLQQQPLQTVTVQQQQVTEIQATPTPPPTAAQLVQQTNAQMVQQAIQLARQQQAQAAAAAAAAQANKASPYTMRLRNPPK